MTQSLLVGIFVGGKSSRMGGHPKGLLAAPDSGETLVARLARIVGEAFPGVAVLLVGKNDAYASLGLRAIADEPSGVGPLGGLTSLLAEARRVGARDAIAIACDLPYVTAELLGRLATQAPAASAVAPRVEDIWQPLLARYRVDAATTAVAECLADGKRSLWSVLEALRTRGETVVSLALTTEEEGLLRDWDSPEDASA